MNPLFLTTFIQRNFLFSINIVFAKKVANLIKSLNEIQTMKKLTLTDYLQVVTYLRQIFISTNVRHGYVSLLCQYFKTPPLKEKNNNYELT